MLLKFRLSLYGFFTKLLLVLVVLSFIFWGVGTNTPSRGEYVAKIDKNHYIYTDKFNQQKQNLIHSIVRMNPSISVDNLNVDSTVLNSMIRNKIMELEYKKLGLFVSDKMAMNEIRKMDFFFNKDGKFDRDFFKRIVINHGMTEKEYVEEQKIAVAAQIFDSAIIPFTPPHSMMMDLYQYQNQDRRLRIIHITPRIDSTVSQPSEEEIQKFYDSHTKDFTVPETRNIEFIVISPKNFSKYKDSEKEMHKAIKDIEDYISSGESLSFIAKKYNLIHQSIDNLSPNSPASQIKGINSEYIPKFLSAAFEDDQENSPSDTVQLSPDSSDYYIFNTKKIFPSQIKLLEKVKKEIITILSTHDSKTLLKRNASSIYRKFIAAPNVDSFIKDNKSQVSEDKITISRTSTKINSTLLDESFNLKEIGGYTNMIQNNDNFVFAVLEDVIMPSANNIPAAVVKDLEKKVSDAVTTATHNELMRYIYDSHVIQVKQQNINPQA